jgi:hypothetical protein
MVARFVERTERESSKWKGGRVFDSQNEISQRHPLCSSAGAIIQRAFARLARQKVYIYLILVAAHRHKVIADSGARRLVLYITLFFRASGGGGGVLSLIAICCKRGALACLRLLWAAYLFINKGRTGAGPRADCESRRDCLFCRRVLSRRKLILLGLAHFCVRMYASAYHSDLGGGMLYTTAAVYGYPDAFLKWACVLSDLWPERTRNE